MVELRNLDFPILETKKITLSKDKNDEEILRVEIDYALRSRSPLTSSGLKTSLSSLYVYFLVLDNIEFEKLYSSLSSPQRKIAIQNILNHSYGNILFKHSNLIRVSLADVLNTSSSPTLRGRGELGTGAFSSIAPSPSNTREMMSKITIKYSNRALFSTAGSPFRPGTATGSTHSRSVGGLHLLCFLDSSENNSSRSASTDLTYDHLLEYNSQTRRLAIPKTRKSFFINDPEYPEVLGQAYQGPVHYHSTLNPGANGYVGWMAGSNKPGHPMGPHLSVKEITNYKVHSDSFVDMAPELQIPIVSLNSTSDTGRKLISFSNVANGGSGTGGATTGQRPAGPGATTSLRERNELSNSIHAGSKKNETFVTKETKRTAHYRSISATNNGHIDSNYCGSVIGINVLKLLKNNSMLGTFINLHLKKKNSAIVREILKFFEIKYFCVKRDKIEEDYKNVNTRSTRVETTDKEKSIDLITSRDINPGKLGSALNSRASIEQIDLAFFDGTLPPPNIKNYLLKDYDLFHNYDHGKYTYSVEVHFTDAPIKYVQNLEAVLSVAVSFFSQYVSVAEAPAVYDSTGQHLYGAYDPVKKRQVKAFANDVRLNKYVSLAIKAYSESYTFFSGRRKNLNQLAKQIMTFNYNQKTAKDFLRNLIKMQKHTIKFLKKFSSYSKTDQVNGKSVHVESKTGSMGSDLLQSSSNTNIVHDVSNLNEVLIDNVPPTGLSEEFPSKTNFLRGLQLHRPTAGANKILEYVPGRYVNISKSRYEVDHNTTSVSNSISSPSSIISLKRVSRRPGVKVFISGRNSTFLQKSRYDRLSSDQKFVFDTKLAVLKSNRGSNSDLKSKPNEFFPGFLQTNNSALSISASGFAKFKNSKDEDKIFEKVLGRIIPDMSSEMQTNILTSAFNAKDFKEFEKSINDTYKEQISLRKTLGVFYQNFHRYLSFNRLLNKQRINKLDYRQIFNRGEARATLQTNETMTNQDIFETEKFRIVCVTPGLGNAYIDDTGFRQMMQANTSRNTSRFTLFKLESDDENKSPSINNGVIVRI